MAKEVDHAEGVVLTARLFVDTGCFFVVNALERSLRNWDLRNTSEKGMVIDHDGHACKWSEDHCQ